MGQGPEEFRRPQRSNARLLLEVLWITYNKVHSYVTALTYCRERCERQQKAGLRRVLFLSSEERRRQGLAHHP